jgi:hypothetical protein
MRIADCVNLVGERHRPARENPVRFPSAGRPSGTDLHRHPGGCGSVADPRHRVSRETAVLRGTVPLAGGFYAVVDIFPWTGGRDYASAVDVRLAWTDPAGNPGARRGAPGSPAAGVSRETGGYWPLPRTGRRALSTAGPGRGFP